jgi:hypothetical protein
VANDQAHPIQFGLWLHPSAAPIADEAGLDQAAFFSGWLTVTKKHERKTVQVMLKTGLAEPHDLYLATRVIDQTNVWFCHALVHDILTLFPN